jgi:Ca-activated chloride channel homolog
MNRWRTFISLVALLCLSPIHPKWSFAWSDTPAEPNIERTLSPYFFIPSGAEGVEQLPLKSTEAVVDIAGVIADVKVTQVYKNAGQTPIEAIYVFPGSPWAAVYGMKMTIGERVQVAKIAERQAAQAEYTQAKAEGKSASLLEQQRPNVFQMSVTNIMPGDEIRVELSYTEIMVPTEGTYEFVYPTVVGPRYSNQPAATAPPSEQWIANPFLREGQPPPGVMKIQFG